MHLYFHFSHCGILSFVLNQFAKTKNIYIYIYLYNYILPEKIEYMNDILFALTYHLIK